MITTRPLDACRDACCGWPPSPRRPRFLPVTIGGAAAHGPDPMLSGGLFAQNQDLRFRWRAGSEPTAVIKTAIKAAAADANATRGSKAATFTYDAGGAEPDRLRSRRDLRRQRPGLLHARAPRPASRCGCASRATSSTGARSSGARRTPAPPNGCYDAETIALDEFGHVEGLNHHVNYANDSDYLDAVVQTYSRTKPAAGWNMHAFGRCDVATLQLQYDMQTWSAKYSTCLDLATSSPSARRRPRSRSAARRRSPRRSRSWTTTRTCGSAATRSRAGPSPSSAGPRARRPGPASGRWPLGAAGGTYVITQSPRSDTDYRAVFATPSNEGINGDTSPTVSVLVFSHCGSVSGSAPGIDTPCI